MTPPRVSFNAETGDAYISLAEPGADRVATSVPLWPVDDQPDALASLVLDFDADGRLVEQLADSDSFMVRDAGPRAHPGGRCHVAFRPRAERRGSAGTLRRER
jgi:hypothetical protein